MSLFHRSAQAEACPASTADQPVLAAAWDAEIADCSGADDVSAVSTPTNFANSYDAPLRASKVISWLAVRFCAVPADESDFGGTAVLNVEATAPSLPVVVRKATSTVRAPVTAPPPVWVTLRAPAPSITSVTVAGPFHRGVIVSFTAPTCGRSRAASTSYTRSVARPARGVHVSDVRRTPQRRKSVWRKFEIWLAGVVAE